MNNSQSESRPLQTPGRPTSRTLVLTIAAIAVTLVFAPTSRAQETAATPAPAEVPGVMPPAPELTPEQQALAEDFYRAEFIILERMIEPSAVDEKMANRVPEPPDLEAEKVLRHTDHNGDVQTTLELVPRAELHLNSAAERLERSGRYRVLLAEGWYQAFPPDFTGKPLWVTIGDWLPGAEHTDVQGMITIDRQRYLHVDVRLNHWVPEAPTESLLGIDLNAETPTRPHPPRIAIEPAGLKDTPPEDETAIDPAEAQAGTADLTPDNAETGQPRALIAGLNWPRAELLTWIRETRRMRSEEVHFLDAPTLGVLIFFKKIEPEDAAPLIRKLGLTGDQEPEESQEAP
ncbi:CsiV family protein [Marinobacter sp.]|uniref:CsiV family protein n=1 Tax=Marinobacter sp. TaxID=50741 RepID=UPI002B4603D5|nr:CsiV family protein [Marinobacter sp.]HKK55492.1 CsiV family protein [Marinobacter sp.]